MANEGLDKFKRYRISKQAKGMKLGLDHCFGQHPPLHRYQLWQAALLSIAMAETMIMAGRTWIALRKLRSIQATPALLREQARSYRLAGLFAAKRLRYHRNMPIERSRPCVRRP